MGHNYDIIAFSTVEDTDTPSTENIVMSDQPLNVFQPYRILCDITFHFNKNRLYFLFQIIRKIFEFPVETIEVVVVTNVGDDVKLTQIRSLCSPLLTPGPTAEQNCKVLTIESHTQLTNPWHLPWSHKHLITEKFLDPAGAFTHYIHIEDDILLSYENFCYFVRYRDFLRDYRLIPTFQRVEFNTIDNKLYLLDQINLIDFSQRNRIEAGDIAFVNPDYPHNAMFILDRELALEYSRSRSFDREQSQSVRPTWGLCERASMGLCFDNPPEGFLHRYVIPVATQTQQTPYWSWVYHIANNYSTNPRSPYGKLPPAHLFGTDASVIRWSPPTFFQNLIWRLKQLPERLWRGAPPSTGNDTAQPRFCRLCQIPEPESGWCPRSGCPGRQAPHDKRENA